MDPRAYRNPRTSEAMALPRRAWLPAALAALPTPARALVGSTLSPDIEAKVNAPGTGKERLDVAFCFSKNWVWVAGNSPDSFSLLVFFG